jgi:hypothetical protein
MEMRKKVYIAGKITGDEGYKAKFKKAEFLIKAQGHAVMNPSILPYGFAYEDYMTICSAMLKICNVIYMLPDWEDSPGACEEHEAAVMAGKVVVYGE